MTQENKASRCVWNLGDACSDDITELDMFNDQINVPICGHHLQGHKEIMFLHSIGMDVEEIILLSPEQRHELFVEKGGEGADVTL